jgi:hypothetical protein
MQGTIHIWRSSAKRIGVVRLREAEISRGQRVDSDHCEKGHTRMKNRWLSTIALTVLVLSAVTGVGATVLYDDTFDSYNPGDSISVAGWIQDRPDKIKFSAAPFGDFPTFGNFIDGATTIGGSENAQGAYVPTGLLNEGVVTLTALLKFTGPGWSSFGLRITRIRAASELPTPSFGTILTIPVM